MIVPQLLQGAALGGNLFGGEIVINLMALENGIGLETGNTQGTRELRLRDHVAAEQVDENGFLSGGVQILQVVP